MKRIISFVSTILLCFSFIACETNKKEMDTSVEKTQAISTQEKTKEQQENTNSDDVFVEDNNLTTETQEILKEKPKVETNASNVKPTTEQVWITSKGKKYHKSSNCSNMKNPNKVDIGNVGGRTPCSKCYN